MKRLVFLFLPLLACTPPATNDAGPDDAGQPPLINPPSDGGMPPVSTDDCPSDPPFLRHEATASATTTTVTACSDDRWVGLDLETRTELLVDDTTATAAWDLAFQRFQVMSNGGVSGAGGVRIAPLTGVAFEDVVEAPLDGFREDLEDGDADGYDDFVISGQDPSWWLYNINTHVIEMTGVVWVVQTVEGRYFKLELLDYYVDIDGNATSGYPSFVWAEIDPPGGAGVDAGPDADGGVTDGG